jgi:hypothetical protein
MNRGRVANLLVCLLLTLLLFGLGRGAAHAQTKIPQPAQAGTIRITKAGSYFLGSNLTTSLTVSPFILVSAKNVTINLNGFMIKGPATSGTGSAGIKVSSPSITGLTIVNGTITQIAGPALSLGGSSSVSGVQIIANSGDGVDCTSSCLVTNNVITGNTGTGLNFSDATSGYGNNVLSGNTTNVTGGTQLGTNICNTGLC